jgi:hypothetical protein
MTAAVTAVLAGMSEEQLLAFGEEQDAAARRAECNKILLAQQWASLHPGGRLDQTETGKPGREQARQLGAEGTPTVAEFAPATLAGRLRMSPWAAARLIGDAIDIAHRLPGIQARVVAGEAEARHARQVAARTRDLTAAEAAVVDEAVADLVDGRVDWARFEQILTGAIAAAAPEVARRREHARHQPTVTRLRGRKHEAHGMATLLVRGDVAAITQIEHALTVRSKALKPLTDRDPETRGGMRLRALLELVTGRSSSPDPTAVAPNVQLHIHAYVDQHGMPHPILRVEGHGPVTTDWLRWFLGPRARFTIRPVLDIPGLAPVDAYEIPAAHRHAVHVIAPADVFPYANSLSRAKEIDHTEPWHPPDQAGPPDQSRIGNYGPMTKRNHRIKTHGRWQVRQPFTGIYLWRDPHAAYYLVDQTGTRRLGESVAA